jgi:phage terminase small subunit
MSEITQAELSYYERLNGRQKAFVDAYLECGEATEAAITAGYSSLAAKTIGYQLIHTHKFIRRALREKGYSLGPSVAGVKEVLQTLTVEMRSAPEPKDRIKAAELLGKRYGIFVTRQEISGKGGKPIEHRVTAKRELDLSNLSNEELDNLESIIRKAVSGDSPRSLTNLSPDSRGEGETPGEGG